MGVEEEVITGNELELVQAEEVVTSLTVPGGTEDSVDTISAVAVGEGDDVTRVGTVGLEQPLEE